VSAARRGVILPVVLFMVLLLALLGAMFAFRVNADLSATQVIKYRLQTRIAAETGIEFAKLILREDRLNMNRWYDNPQELHRIILWAHDVDPAVLGTYEKLDQGTMAYRFSLVADDPTDDEKFVRFCHRVPLIPQRFCELPFSSAYSAIPILAPSLRAMYAIEISNSTISTPRAVT